MNSNKSYGAYVLSPGEYASGQIHPKSSNPAQLYGSSESSGPAQIMRGLRPDLELKDQEAMRKEKNSGISRPLSAREQLFGSNCLYYDETSPQLSPVYQSEAAREIIMEMSNSPARRTANRRQIRKEKRRHHTVSNIRHVTDNENHLSRMVCSSCVYVIHVPMPR